MLCVSQALAVSVVFVSVIFLHHSLVLCNAESPMGKNVKDKMEVQDFCPWYWGRISDYFQN